MRTLARGIASSALVALLTVPAIASFALANADPGTDVTSDPGTNVVGWNQLGLTNRIELLGYNQPSDDAVPVPQGVTPAVVTGQIGSVVNVTTGRVDVYDARGILLGTIPVPVGPATEPFVVDTSAAQISDGVARLSFVLRGDDAHSTTSCSQSPAVTLTQLATTFSGEAPNPRTVADFLPGYLDAISIRVGPNPSHDQQQAALSLVAKLTQHYRPIPVRIDVDTSADPPAPMSTSTGRVIEIRDGGPPAVSVENGGTPAAVLVISGQGSALSRQIELFADRRVLLAQSQSASVTSSSDELTSSSQTLSFAQLGIAGQASVLGTTTLYAGFDVSRFAVGSIQGAKIHLLAQYTAVESGQGSVLIRSGDTVLASRALDKSGSLDLSVDVPADAIASNVGLALELRYLPDKECPPTTARITFALDPRSTVSVQPGSDSRSGFAGLPMAFTPDFDVAVDHPDQIRYAARAINLIGQQTALPLRPNVRAIADVAKSRVGLLVVSSGDWLKRSGMNPPLMPAEGASVKVDGSPVTDVDLNGPLGVVQTFSDNGRTVLALNTSGDSALLDRSLDYIAGLEGRWASLSGDVVATGAAGSTVNLTVRNMAPEPAASKWWKWWTWITVAVGAAAVLAVASTLIIRRRRAKTKG